MNTFIPDQMVKGAEEMREETDKALRENGRTVPSHPKTVEQELELNQKGTRVFRHLLIIYTIVMLLRLVVHLFASISMAKFAVSDDGDTVKVTRGAYNGLLAVTVFEISYYLFMIMAVKLLNSTIGGSQILFIVIIALLFMSTNLFLLCWWTSSFGKANKFNKSY